MPGRLLRNIPLSYCELHIDKASIDSVKISLMDRQGFGS